MGVDKSIQERTFCFSLTGNSTEDQQKRLMIGTLFEKCLQKDVREILVIPSDGQED